MTLGALLQGITVEGRAYAGGWWDWLTPFSLLTGASLVIGYALLGATWLIWKTEGRCRSSAFRFARIAGIGLHRLRSRAVSLATPFLEEAYYERWFAWPDHAVHRAGAAAGRDRGRRLVASAWAAHETAAVPAGAGAVRCSAWPGSASASGPDVIPGAVTI